MEPKATRQDAAAVEADARVSAVVVAGRAVGHPIDLCLRSALADPWVDELVVVDNGATADIASTLRGLKADRRDVVLLQGHGDIGRAAGSNLGAAAARGRWLLFLDPTVVIKSGSVGRMVAAGRRAATPCIVGGRLLDTKGRDHRDARRAVPTLRGALADAMGLSAPRARAPSAVSGAMMLTYKADFQRLGGFEGGMLEPFDDVELCRKATEAGGAVVVAPRAEGVQFARGRPNARSVGEGLSEMLQRSARTPVQRAMARLAAPIVLGAYWLRRRATQLFRGPGA